MSPELFHVLFLESVPEEDIPCFLSLQGIVNRDAPRIYLFPKPDGFEKHWIEWYKSYGLEGEEVTAENLLSTYANRARGYIVYDPETPDSLNAAIALAGVESALVCHPSSAPKLDSLGLSLLADFSGKWENKISAAQWAVQNILPRCDLAILANYFQEEGPRPFPTMDFLVARKGFCLGLSVNDADYPDEARIWDEVQTKAPDHAMMLGWHTKKDSEATHVYFCSRHNIQVYCAFAWNMSFHQHVKAKKSYVQEHSRRKRSDPGARYATITLSDGDSWHSMCDGQKKFWSHPRRGEVPLGWEVAPIFARVAPAVLEYYYETRTENDYLVCGPSGIGYNYLSGFPDWKGYLRRSAELMRETSLKTIWTINRVVRHLPGGAIEHQLKGGAISYSRKQMEEFGGVKDQKGADLVDAEVIERYMKYIPEAYGFFQGWERIPGENPRIVNGKLWCPSGALVRDDIDAVMREFEESASAQSLPAFVSAHVNCYKADMDVVIETVRRLKQKGFSVVKPDEFLRLARDAYERKEESHSDDELSFMM
ncbi:hypothetical protein JW926_12645 [Candidatus Sumerlaeota bacterium]|nr:hypothetical protein [Candidatus Sumerlaeota bacterium]